MRTIDLYDSTLRDGSQGEGISFSVEDKLKITRALDELGIAFVEAGNPGSNAKDQEFFRVAKELRLNHARLVAFGSTRRKGKTAEQDANLNALLEAETEYVAVFGKTWTFQVSEILHATKAENLEMIRDSVAYLVGKGRKVFFDAEHFFDGYQADPAYAMECLRVAREAGVEALVLCETRGGMLPDVVGRVTKAVTETFSCPIGIHAHDDSGCAVANSLAAVDAGAVQVQGTLLGYGERCGNACLSTIMADLVLKKGMECTGGERLTRLTPVCRKVAEISNVAIPHSMPYVGASAFAHKGGMHIDGVKKNPLAYEHVEPSSVGNERRLLMSEVAGRALMLDRIRTVLPGSKKDDPQIIALMDLLKRLEADGYQFEGAESSFDLVIRRHLAAYHPFFSLVHYQTIGSLPYADPNSGYSHDAVVKVLVGNTPAITAAEGEGPVNALDKALRKVLEPFYPTLKTVHLTDYKVRVLSASEATASKVRVLIESTDGKESWSTIGVSKDIIEASWLALVDSIEYYLIKNGVESIGGAK
ncbi:MAG: citramalate synthase [Sphaerochaeta sp.]|jgi:2-isopropylmalate synthase|nr:citramalate synthase [Sphaerochaeta sp.]